MNGDRAASGSRLLSSRSCSFTEIGSSVGIVLFMVGYVSVVVLIGECLFCRTSAITNNRLHLAWLLPAKRDQQEPCQKSRRDGDLLDWHVRLFFIDREGPHEINEWSTVFRK